MILKILKFILKYNLGLLFLIIGTYTPWSINRRVIIPVSMEQKGCHQKKVFFFYLQFFV